jgi:hypothetical protein
MYILSLDLVDRNGQLTGTGSWTNGVVSNFTGSVSGGQVILNRLDADGYRARMAGRGVDTNRFQGTYDQSSNGATGSFVMTRVGQSPPPPPPPPPPAFDLGGTLVWVAPGVCVAIWTRTQPGTYDAVTVCQGPGNASFREILTVESNDGRSVVIKRPNYGRYRGTLSADRKTITGTCDWSGCTTGFDWTAYVDWDWRRSPPLK